MNKKFNKEKILEDVFSFVAGFLIGTSFIFAYLEKNTLAVLLFVYGLRWIFYKNI